MKVDIQENLRGTVVSSHIDRAVQILEQEVGQSREIPTSEWRLEHSECGKALAVVKLSDSTGSVEARFTPEQLANEGYMRDRLSWLWGDLLQVRSHAQLKKLHELVQQLDEE